MHTHAFILCKLTNKPLTYRVLIYAIGSTQMKALYKIESFAVEASNLGHPWAILMYVAENNDISAMKLLSKAVNWTAPVPFKRSQQAPL